MECDVDICKFNVVVPSGMNVNMFNEVSERMSTVPVSSIPSAMKIKVHLLAPVAEGSCAVLQSSRGAVDAGKELVLAFHLDNPVNGKLISVNAIARLTR